MGFADKVTNALAKPASPRSDGKENVYLGFRNGHGQRDGFGVMQVENGPTYTGQWSGSKREGHGTLFFDKGVFEGQWIQGNAHGKGIVHFKNGDTFQGNYQQNRKCGFGTYTWADGTVESGDYLEGQKHGQHHWRRGDERWEMFYHQGDLVATKRREEVEARKNSAKSAEVSKASDQKGKKEFVAQKLAMDKARPAPKPTPPPSPPSEQRAAVPSTSTSSRCRSNSAFRAQGFTDEEIALMERKSPPSSPTHPLPDRAAQPGGSSARVFFPTSARARPASTAVAAPGKGLPSTGAQRVVPTSAAVPVASRAASTSSSSMAPAQAALAADAAAGAAVEPPPEPKPEPKPPEALDPAELEPVDSEEEAASEEPSTPGVHDG